MFHVRANIEQLYCRVCGRGPLHDKLDTTVPSRMRHYGRGLDGACYERERHHRQLEQHPIPDRVRRPVSPGRTRAELVEDYEFLYSMGETHPEALARQLGVSTAMVRQLKREAAA